MPTALDTTAAIQEKIFTNLQVGQRAVLDMVRSWADTTEFVFAKVPELTLADPAGKPTLALESTLGFTEKVLTSQREFANKVFEAAMPATRAPASAAQAAKSQAAKA